MRTFIVLLCLVSGSAGADWVVPPTGIVDYSGQTPSPLPTFTVPVHTTVIEPLPAWSNPPVAEPIPPANMANPANFPTWGE